MKRINVSLMLSGLIIGVIIGQSIVVYWGWISAERSLYLTNVQVIILAAIIAWLNIRD